MFFYGAVVKLIFISNYVFRGETTKAIFANLKIFYHITTCKSPVTNVFFYILLYANREVVNFDSLIHSSTQS